MKVKFMRIPFFITIIAIFLSRVYQFIFIKDSAARSNWEIIEMSLFVIAAISVIIMAILSFRPKGAIFSFSFTKSTSTAVIGILSGIAIICDGSYKLFQYINEYRDLMHLLVGTFGIATGIIFIFISVSLLKGKRPLNNKGLLALIPVIWGIFRLLELFFTYYSTSNKIWSVPDEFAVIFLLLFLFNLARIFADINSRKELVRLIFCGLSSVIFIFIYTTLSFANQIILNNTILNTGSITLIMDLSIAIYIVMIINAVKLEKENNNSNHIEPSIDTYEKSKEEISNSKDINMSQIDTLVDKIKKEDGLE